MTPPNQIHAANGYEFQKQLALFSYSSFLDHGIGVVSIQQEQYSQHPDGSVDAYLKYVPYALAPDLFPSEIIEQMNEYDPDTEFVISIMASSGEATIATVKGEVVGLTPESLWRAAMKDKGKISLVPGQVVELMEHAADIDPGWYVFERQEGGWLYLSVVGMDEDEGDMIAMEDKVKLHIDFAELLRRTNINVNDEEG